VERIAVGMKTAIADIAIRFLPIVNRGINVMVYLILGLDPAQK